MKEVKGVFSLFYGRSRLFKIISLIIMIIFTMHIYILPSALSITIEEEVKRSLKRKRSISQTDEFSRKTPVRRDDRRLPEEYDPRLACLLSLVIPGGGDIYLRKDLKGIAFCLLTVAGYSSAGYYLYKANDDDASSSEKRSKLIISGLLFFVAAITHVIGIVEAYNDAIEINEKKIYYGAEKSKSPYIADLQLE